MKNKNVGFLIVGIAIVISVIIGIFNSGLKSIVKDSCSHGPECSMYGTIGIQTWISFAIAGLVALIGLFLIFSKEEKEIIVKTVNKKIEVEKKAKPIDYSKLDKEEKVIMKAVEDAQGTIFQSDLVDKSEFSKVKVTRVLDRLEGKQMIERKRRGMTNVVILKNS